MAALLENESPIRNQSDWMEVAIDNAIETAVSFFLRHTRRRTPPWLLSGFRSYFFVPVIGRQRYCPNVSGHIQFDPKCSEFSGSTYNTRAAAGLYVTYV